ncbi:lysozyme [Sphingobium sp. TB-6]|uniref:lysozyme n=1 Tax=Sphingobium sp. TB-6 TaxID=2728850 RepID=UPI00146BD6BE|nr:lysozyme [Sphingobium sp. TB-6]NML88365.1 lysozyme [Sphingobium sp. TB-6]
MAETTNKPIAAIVATALVAAPVGVVVSDPAADVATGLIQKWEGTKTVPYKDLIGKWTVCTGETRVAMRTYSLGECKAFLRRAIRSDYGLGVLKCAPSLQNTVYQLGAAISVAYNIGVTAWCGSTMAKQFNAGDWFSACQAFALWNKAGGVVVTGLANRRNDEMRACFTNLSPERTLTPKVAA